MAPPTNDLSWRTTRSRRPAFGPAVWGWGLASGLLLWSAGFLHMPWWAALLLWWWPSLLFGAAVGLAAVGLARLINRVTEARRIAGRRGAPPRSG